MTAYNNAVFMRACARIEWKWIVFYFFPPLCFRLSAFFTLRSKEMSDQLCYLKKLRLKLFIIVDEQFKYLNLKEPTIFGKWWWNGWARTTILRPVFGRAFSSFHSLVQVTRVLISHTMRWKIHAFHVFICTKTVLSDDQTFIFCSDIIYIGGHVKDYAYVHV